jgi:Fe-S-cluster-containing dehydrogenase component
MEVCPAKAISRDEKSGAVVVAEELCLGCKMCVLTCPFGGPRVSRDTGRVVKCDLCGGDMQCVSNCPTGAIQFMDVNELVLEKMKASAMGLVKEELERIAQRKNNEESDKGVKINE